MDAILNKKDGLTDPSPLFRAFSRNLLMSFFVFVSCIMLFLSFFVYCVSVVISLSVFFFVKVYKRG